MLVLAALTVLVLPGAQPAPAKSAQVAVLTVARQRAMLAVAAVTVVLTLGHYTLYTYITPFLLSAHVSTHRVSVVLLGYGTAGIVGLVLAGRIADRKPRRGLYVAASALTTCLLTLGFTHAWTAPVVGVVVI